MEVGSIAASLVAARMGQVQTAAAAHMLRMNAENAASIVKVLEAAQQNIDKLTKAAVDGLGGNVDISV
jgi:anthranilate phosphoribosyltransferase